MRDRLSTLVAGSLLALCLLGPGASPAPGQPPSASCDGNENLTGADILPQNLSLGAPLSNDFTMTGTNCNEQGVDHVTCFVPQNNCGVIFDCAYVPPGAATIAVNVYSGSCAASPSTCIASNSGLNFASVQVALTAGTQYCVVCESSVNVTNLNLDLGVDSGDCGALPVQLQQFSISRAGAAEDPRPEAAAGDDF